jgi:PAS domain S-box-containing protein
MQTLTTSEKQAKTADGSAWYMIRNLPYRTVDDVIAGVVVNFVDITQLKRAEAALRQSEERFSKAFRASPAGILLAALDDGRIIDINDAGTAALGCSREEAIGRTTVELGLWRDDAERSEVIVQLQESGEHELRRETSLVWGSGKTRFLDVRYELIELQDKPCFLVICNDVTEYKQALASLESEQVALQKLVDLQEHDRQLTAFEIHDGLAQLLVGAQFRLEAFGSQSASGDPAAEETVAQALEQLRAAVKESRRLINGLRPSALEEFGIISAIEQLIADQESLGGPAILFSHDLDNVRLAPPLENAIFRIIQESLTNVRRHSGSERVQVELVRHGDRLRIRVEDWGVGFDVSSVEEGRFGLRGIAERARLLGGRSVVDSAPGRGTRILVELPVVKALSEVGPS